MKRRERRVVMGAAALVGGIVAVLIVVGWNTVLNHLEAWHFQLTRETLTCEPLDLNQASPNEVFHVLSSPEMLSTCSKRRVIFDITDHSKSDRVWKADSSSTLTAVDEVLHVLREDGWRVLEQRFPQRAYIMIRVAHPRQEQRTGLLFDGVDLPAPAE